MTTMTMVWGWSDILWVSLIGFTLVLLMLLGLVGIMKIFGAAFRLRRPADDPRPEPSMISEEEVAAIAMAIKLFRGDLHDRESEILTILSIKRAYSPWNSKIHGLTPLPERK